MSCGDDDRRYGQKIFRACEDVSASCQEPFCSVDPVIFSGPGESLAPMEAYVPSVEVVIEEVVMEARRAGEAIEVPLLIQLLCYEEDQFARKVAKHTILTNLSRGEARRGERVVFLEAGP